MTDYLKLALQSTGIIEDEDARDEFFKNHMIRMRAALEYKNFSMISFSDPTILVFFLCVPFDNFSTCFSALSPTSRQTLARSTLRHALSAYKKNTEPEVYCPVLVFVLSAMAKIEGSRIIDEFFESFEKFRKGCNRQNIRSVQWSRAEAAVIYLSFFLPNHRYLPAQKSKNFIYTSLRLLNLSISTQTREFILGELSPQKQIPPIAEVVLHRFIVALVSCCATLDQEE